MVFIGGMTIQRNSAQQVIERCRDQGITLVAGGPMFSVAPAGF